MHILFETSEKAILKGCPLPDGTSLVEQFTKGEGEDATIENVARWSIKDGQWVLEVDFKEQERPFTEEEKAKFCANMTKERVFDFFLNYFDDKTPQREYSEMHSAEYNLFKYLNHSRALVEGSRYKTYRTIQIRIPRSGWSSLSGGIGSDDVDEAESEIAWALERVKNANLECNPIHIDLIEHTLSEFGGYGIEWDRDQTFKLFYSNSNEPEFVASGLKELIKYLSKRHWYDRLDLDADEEDSNW